MASEGLACAFDVPGNSKMTLLDSGSRRFRLWPLASAPATLLAQTDAPTAPAPRSEHVTWESEAFIPVSRFEIAERMVTSGQWGADSPDTIRRLFRYMSAWRHVVYKERLDELEQTYQPFSPETDLLRVGEFTAGQQANYRDRFIAGMKRLLRQANYIEVARVDVHSMMKGTSQYGLDLKVELEDFEECIIYRRGTDFRTEQRRSMWTLYLFKHKVRFPVYQRLCVLLKLWPEEARITQVMAESKVPRWRAARIVRKSRSTLPAGLDSDKIYIKLFKDIPHADLEMLFPNTQVRFSRLDKLRLGGSAASGVGLGIFGAFTKLMAVAVFTPYALVIAAFGIAGIIIRQIMGFFNQRTQYMKVLAENLYFHSLADNRSAFTLLANRAEEEDIKEEMLLYAVLATEPIHRHELPDVKAHISSYLRQQFDVDVDFDIDDALGRLIRDSLVTEGPDGLLATLTPTQALAHLDGMWDSYLHPQGMDRRLLDEDADVARG